MSGKNALAVRQIAELKERVVELESSADAARKRVDFLELSLAGLVHDYTQLLVEGNKKQRLRHNRQFLVALQKSAAMLPAADVPEEFR